VVRIRRSNAFRKVLITANPADIPLHLPGRIALGRTKESPTRHELNLHARVLVFLRHLLSHRTLLRIIRCTAAIPDPSPSPLTTKGRSVA
jgi:hypothetical protein